MILLSNRQVHIAAAMKYTILPPPDPRLGSDARSGGRGPRLPPGQQRPIPLDPPKITSSDVVTTPQEEEDYTNTESGLLLCYLLMMMCKVVGAGITGCLLLLLLARASSWREEPGQV